jgi:ligand-binding sensor protein
LNIVRIRIRVYRVVNLAEMHVEVFTNSRTGKKPAYREHECFRVEFGVPIVIAGREIGRIPVRHLFP